MALSKPEKIRKAIELLSSLGSDDDDEPQPAAGRRTRTDSQSALQQAGSSNLANWQRRPSESQPAAAVRRLELIQGSQYDSEAGLQPGPSNVVESWPHRRSSIQADLFSGRSEKTSHGNEGIYTYMHAVSTCMQTSCSYMANNIYT